MSKTKLQRLCGDRRCFKLVVSKHFNRILILSILDTLYFVSIVWQEPGASHWRDSEGAARRRRDRRSLLEKAWVRFSTINNDYD